MFKRTNKITFEINICIVKDDVGYHAFCPALKGVHMDGDTQEEAKENVKTAIELYINSLRKHNEPIPLQIISNDDMNNICFKPNSHLPSAIRPPIIKENVFVTV